MYARIAVATDGSVHGNRAIDTAADLAVKYDDELTVVHVLIHGSSPDTPHATWRKPSFWLRLTLMPTLVARPYTNYIDFSSRFGTRPCRACRH